MHCVLARVPPRAQRDAFIAGEIQRVWDENPKVNGARKVWLQLRRERFVIARCTVARLMAQMGLRGVVRGKRSPIMTVGGANDERPLGLVNREFVASRSNLAEEGIDPSVGSVGDSYDNAMAELIIGLFKAEVIRPKGPWRGLEAVEYATLEWVDWFNNRQLLGPIGDIPPVEFETAYYDSLEAPAMAAGLN